MVRWIKDVYNSFSENIHNLKSMRYFRVGLYLLLLYQTLVLCLPISDLIWGDGSMIQSVKFQDNWSYNFYMLLHNPRYASWYPYIIAIQIISLLVGLSRKFTRIAAVLIYITTVLLFNRAYLMLTGGNYLIHIYLFFLIFINENGIRRGVNAILTNAFYWALRIQFIIVYLFSALYKWNGEVWLKGETLHYLLNMQEFSLPFLVGNVEGVQLIMKFLTYFALLYQTLFPILVWVKKIKPIYLLIGIGFHLLTIILNGVPMFGMTMIVSYILFLSEDQVSKLFSGRLGVVKG